MTFVIEDHNYCSFCSGFQQTSQNKCCRKIYLPSTVDMGLARMEWNRSQPMSPRKQGMTLYTPWKRGNMNCIRWWRSKKTEISSVGNLIFPPNPSYATLTWISAKSVFSIIMVRDGQKRHKKQGGLDPKIGTKIWPNRHKK